MTMDVFVPLHVAVVGLALVVVVAFGADRQLVGTLAVDVVHGGLLTARPGHSTERRADRQRYSSRTHPATQAYTETTVSHSAAR